MRAHVGRYIIKRIITRMKRTDEDRYHSGHVVFVPKKKIHVIAFLFLQKIKKKPIITCALLFIATLNKPFFPNPCILSGTFFISITFLYTFATFHYSMGHK